MFCHPYPSFIYPCSIFPILPLFPLYIHVVSSLSFLIYPCCIFPILSLNIHVLSFLSVLYISMLYLSHPSFIYPCCIFHIFPTYIHVVSNLSFLQVSILLFIHDLSFLSFLHKSMLYLTYPSFLNPCCILPIHPS